MSIPDEALKTINILILNWQRTIVLTTLALISVMVLFPIIIVCFLLAQGAGTIPSESAVSHFRLEKNQTDIRNAAELVAKDLKRQDSFINQRDEEQRAGMRALIRTNLAQCAMIAAKEKDPRPWMRICVEESEPRQKQMINEAVELKNK